MCEKGERCPLWSSIGVVKARMTQPLEEGAPGGGELVEGDMEVGGDSLGKTHCTHCIIMSRGRTGQLHDPIMPHPLGQKPTCYPLQLHYTLV